MPPTRWQPAHFCWIIGATSRVKLGGAALARAAPRRRECGERDRECAGAPPAAIASCLRLRMLGVICTPKLAEDAADLADGAAGASAPRASAGAGSRRSRRCSAPRPAPALPLPRLARRAPEPSAPAGAARSRDRPAAARPARRPPSPKRLTPTTTRGPRLDVGLEAERRGVDLRLDESLLDRSHCAAQLVHPLDELARLAPRARSSTTR